VLSAGQHPDACYWFEPATGNMVTSIWYREKGYILGSASSTAPAWWTVGSTTTGRACARASIISLHAGPRRRRRRVGQGHRSGPHFPPTLRPAAKWRVGPGLLRPRPLQLAVRNDLLLDPRQASGRRETTGPSRHARPALGQLLVQRHHRHIWGPDSQEVLERHAAFRSDREAAPRLPRRSGRPRPLPAVVDGRPRHLSLPEVARGQGKDAARVNPELLARQAEAFLDMHYGPNAGKARWIMAADERLAFTRQPARAADAQPGTSRGGGGHWRLLETASPTPRALTRGVNC